MRSDAKTLAERFEGKYIRSDGCWNWTAFKDHGYGKLTHFGKCLYAHRVSYELHIGPIPQGMTIDHTCRNTACVNPQHLRVLSLLDNIRAGVKATAVVCIRGHPFTPENTYRRSDGRRSCKVCRDKLTEKWNRIKSMKRRTQHGIC
jgi:hypothetical protein